MNFHNDQANTLQVTVTILMGIGTAEFRSHYCCAYTRIFRTPTLSSYTCRNYILCAGTVVY